MNRVKSRIFGFRRVARSDLAYRPLPYYAYRAAPVVPTAARAAGPAQPPRRNPKPNRPARVARETPQSVESQTRDAPGRPELESVSSQSLSLLS